ncbi:unnamed protein product [Protopolystoma xenopodis]|uniref:Uncharacterized protein n=1 Tax=Protopolystoma xenopodis TaxID=117903 RepID=A0A448XM45_9PLAT|nr:unnamed protein product [Protopolystoma xenopodis]
MTRHQNPRQQQQPQHQQHQHQQPQQQQRRQQQQQKQAFRDGLKFKCLSVETASTVAERSESLGTDSEDAVPFHKPNSEGHETLIDGT